jgi:hypothetical protein
MLIPQLIQAARGLVLLLGDERERSSNAGISTGRSVLTASLIHCNSIQLQDARKNGSEGQS